MEEKTPVVGKFVWHDLITKDIEGALKFYRDLLNWNYSEFEMGGPDKYNMIQVGDKTIGGFVNPEMEDVPPHWSAYVTVADMDKSIESVKSLGGRVVLGPREIPNVGSFAVTFDPQGASIDLYTSLEEVPSDQPKPQFGEFCWDECLADDPAEAANYYGKVFGWTYKEVDMGPSGKYWMAKRGELDAAGIMKKPADVPAPPHWMTYVFVADLDATTRKAGELGGKVLSEPFPVPNIGRVSIIQDSVGAAIGLFGDPVEPA